MMKPIFIVVESKGIIGNPIIVKNIEDEIVTDSNHQRLNVVLMTPNWKTAVQGANTSDKQIYVLKEGNKAWFKRKY